MSKFKVGDKVRLIPGGNIKHPHTPEFNVDLSRIYEVSAVDAVGGLSLFGHPRGGHAPDRFELVESPDEELQRLVDKANEGLKALRSLKPHVNDLIYVNKLGTLVDVGPHGLFNSDGPLHYQELLIKPKPKFEPFTTSNGWNVHVASDRLHIGCKNFPLNGFKAELHELLEKNRAYACDRNLQATYAGVKYMEHTLPWADAEKIYEQLKRLE